MPAPKRILVLATTAREAERLRKAADKLALEVVLGCSDDTGALHLDFSTRDSALHIVEFVQQNPVAAIIPVGDATGPSAARASSMAGLPFHPPKAADSCENKDLLLKKLQAAGIPVSMDTTTGIECMMATGKLRVLATSNAAGKPGPFSSLPSDTQKKVPDLLRRIIAALRLKHGPVRVELSTEPAVTKVSLCYERTALTESLRFRIPLVDDDISYEEVLIRNALDLDITRIHLDTK